jgi:molybdenum cofactor synthesis domain-containing protein
MIAATRIIPLFTEMERIEGLEAMARKRRPVLQIWPYIKSRIGLVVTGSEVYDGLIADDSDRWVVSHFRAYGCELVRKIVTSDDAGQIARAVKTLADEGCELIVTTGGLSIDPDDVTRQGVRNAGAEIISYGSPILPGAMFLNARLGDVPILGLPAAVFYYPRTVYDLMLPRVLAGKLPNAADIAAMGHGGLCMNCEVCHFPQCPFGR